MAKTAVRIIRKSIFTFLKNYEYFTSTPALLAFPFAISTLLSQSLISQSSYLFLFVQTRLRSLFLAAGFPELFALVDLKLSQTILTFLFALPFTLSFLLLAKASVIRALGLSLEYYHQPWILLFNPLLITQICNLVAILSVNATFFCILVVCFDVLRIFSPGLLFLLSATGAVVYSIILANAYIMCNLALILSGIDKQGGFISIFRACVLIRGRVATALSLAVPINVGLAGIEALFQYRVVRAYNHRAMALNTSMVLEGILIGYLYAILLVLDTIAGSLFLESCKRTCRIDQEDVYCHKIEIQENECVS
ncbi:hypothetical protein ACJIZ3_005393 [Penstemon smallii]|uniref:Transmembrane protein n=1 Tax=Penstemon smallii TaxID=265156 RepID=A0ABD3S4S2_9LAMI